MANTGRQCKPVFSRRLWGILFGTLALNDWMLPKLDNKHSYRISEKMLWSDIVITVLGAWLVSVTTRTLSVEQCPSEYIVQRQAERHRERQRALADWAAGQDVEIHTNEGQVYQGRLLAYKTDGWVLEISDTESSQDRLVFRDGHLIYGELLSQSDDSVRFKTAEGVRRYSKKDLKSIQLRKEKSGRQVSIPSESVQAIFFSGRERPDSSKPPAPK